MWGARVRYRHVAAPWDLSINQSPHLPVHLTGALGHSASSGQTLLKHQVILKQPSSIQRHLSGRTRQILPSSGSNSRPWCAAIIVRRVWEKADDFRPVIHSTDPSGGLDQITLRQTRYYKYTIHTVNMECIRPLNKTSATKLCMNDDPVIFFARSILHVLL